jgi:hypothetical protein
MHDIPLLSQADYPGEYIAKGTPATSSYSKTFKANSKDISKNMVS